MKFKIKVNDFRVNILNPDISLNQQLTRLALEERDIKHEVIRSMLAFQPQAILSIQADRYEDLIAAIRFDTYKDEDLLMREYLTQGLSRSMVFRADEVADLRPFRRGARICGNWKLEASLTFFKTSLLRNLDEERFNSVIRSLPNYTVIGRVQFRVIQHQEIELLPTGELREPRRNRPQDAEIVIDASNI